MSLPASNLSGRRLLQLLAAATFCYWLGLTVLMHMPLPARPPEVEETLPKDKTVHFVLYGGFATMLLAVATQRARVQPESMPRTRLGRYAAVLAFCAAHGYLEELTQPLTGRTYDPSDFTADCLGVTAALLLWFVVGRLAALRS